MLEALAEFSFLGRELEVAGGKEEGQQATVVI